ncbi:hypothetical protein RHSIM_Rhsim13G0140000 [Rhododendron simsii]|uniref:C2H2-type domain-containing protein n=1 Tax=Rhododendron simsii TaxID=118357 RepID=A0A834G617_RHOSS|nr:hypothetical protein RHSIM_Rhsim13G0140000 [Rhododendron simsii]
MTVLKRSREQDGDVEALAMANSLMVLISLVSAAPSRIFACKTCNREFPLFQALGGHRASHKKCRLTAVDRDFLQSQTTPEKPKAHECSICGLEFAIGQAAAAEREAAAAEREEGEVEVGHKGVPRQGLLEVVVVGVEGLVAGLDWSRRLCKRKTTVEW